jgi:hypothetical protein
MREADALFEETILELIHPAEGVRVLIVGEDEEDVGPCGFLSLQRQR